MRIRRKKGLGGLAGARAPALILAAACMCILIKNPYFASQVWAAETITYEGPVFTENEENFQPEEILEQGGRQYRLVSSRIKGAVKEGTLTYALASISYTLEGREEPPETAVITLKDEATGKEYEREVPRQGMEEKSSAWLDDFKFQVTVSGYDADVFYLGDVEIPADAELSGYGEEFLEYLGLPLDCYRVNEILWIGEKYEENGMICRNAEARGSRLVRDVAVKYGGQVRTPEIKGKQYIGIYEEIVPETEATEESSIRVREIAREETEDVHLPEAMPEKAPLEKLFYWIREHMTVVTLSAGFFLLLFLAAILFWLSVRKRKGRAD